MICRGKSRVQLLSAPDRQGMGAFMRRLQFTGCLFRVEPYFVTTENLTDIPRVAEELSCNLILVDTCECGGAERMTLEDAARRLSAKVPCPLVVVSEGTTRGSKDQAMTKENNG
jgi:hypothetical protein